MKKYALKNKLLFSFIILLFIIALIPMAKYPRWFQAISNPHKGYDLAQHVLLFFILLLLIWKTFEPRVFSFKRWLIIVLIAIAIGGGLELLQGITGRTASWKDFCPNCSGVFFAAMLVLTHLKLIKHKTQNIKHKTIKVPKVLDDEERL